MLAVASVAGMFKPTWTRPVAALSSFAVLFALAWVTAPFNSDMGRFRAETGALLKGQAVSVPSNFNGHFERYEFIIPGAKIVPYFAAQPVDYQDVDALFKNYALRAGAAPRRAKTLRAMPRHRRALGPAFAPGRKRRYAGRLQVSRNLLVRQRVPGRARGALILSLSTLQTSEETPMPRLQRLAGALTLVAMLALGGCATAIKPHETSGAPTLGFQNMALNPGNGGELIAADALLPGDIILTAENGLEFRRYPADHAFTRKPCRGLHGQPADRRSRGIGHTHSQRGCDAGR